MSQNSAILIIDPVSSGRFLKNYAVDEGKNVIAVHTLSDDLLKGTDKYISEAKKNAGTVGAFYSKTVEEAIAKLEAFDYEIEAVIPGSEPGVQLAEELAKELKLPGNNPESCQKRRNKYVMRQAVKDAGLPSPNFAFCTTLKDVEDFISRNEFPLVLKALESAGSDHISVCHNKEQLFSTFNEYINQQDIFGNTLESLILEEYLDGPQYVVELFIDQENKTITSIWEMEYDEVPGTIWKDRFASIRLHDNSQLCNKYKAICDYAKGVCKAVEINIGPALVEIRDVKGKGPMLIEVGSRLSGIDLPMLMNRYSNFNPYKEIIDLYCGKKEISTRDVNINATVSLIYIPVRRDGLVKSIQGLEEIQGLDCFIQHKQIAKPGKYVVETKDQNTFAAVFYVACPSFEASLRTEKFIRQTFKLVMEGETESKGIGESLAAKFSNILESENIIFHRPKIREYEQSTLASNNKISLVLKPSLNSEISDILKICNREKIKIYPISKGKNYGFGSRLPVEDQSVVLDLSMMKQITDFSEDFGFVRVQPGVTFQDLYLYLENNGSNLMLNVIGGSPEASVLGNILERGDGNGRHGDRSKFVCNMEVVLPNGNIIQTGHGSFRNAQTSNIFDHGVGPNFNQAFIQSNLGIVTELTLWLHPKGNFRQFVHYSLKNQDKFPEFINAFRQLKLEGIIPSNCGMWNDFRSLSTLMRIGSNKETINRLELEKSNEFKGLYRWNGMFPVYSQSKSIGIAIQDYLLEKMSLHVDRLLICTEDLIEHTKESVIIKGEVTDFAVFGKLQVANNIMKGIPSYQSLKSCYWRKNELPKNMNPDKDSCGVLWATFALPMEGKTADWAQAKAEDIISKYGFEPHITLLFPQNRTMYFLAMILYDRSTKGQDCLAMQCHDKLNEVFMENGLFPYRLGIQSMSAIKMVDPSYVELLHAIKEKLDPENILSPGRYDFSHLASQ